MLDIDPRQQTPRTPPPQPPRADMPPRTPPPPQPTRAKKSQEITLGGSVWYFGILAFVVVLISAGLWGLSFYKKQRTKTLTNEIQDLDADLSKLSDIEEEAIALKSQYQNVSSALNNRLIWTKFIEVLSSDTLKAARFDSLSVTAEEDSISLSGRTDSITNIAKLLVAFERSKNFPQVSLNSFSLPSEENTEYSFGITISWKKSIIQPEQSKKK